MTTPLHELCLVARLFGRLFVREVDADMYAQLQQPDVHDALASMGIRVPVSVSEEAILEALSVEYCSAFLVAPEQIVLVQSLWEQGSYEGESVKRLRELAEAADLAYDKDAARGAPLDHLGSILQLWGHVAESWPEARDYLVERHLMWAIAPLSQLAVRTNFYGQLASATLDLLSEIQQATLG